jgi:hypothetical protein
MKRVMPVSRLVLSALKYSIQVEPIGVLIFIEGR